MWARKSPRGSAGELPGTEVTWNIGAGVLVSCDYVGDNICCWTIGR